MKLHPTNFGNICFILGRTIRKVMGGGGGEFSSRRNFFFRNQIPCMNFFQAIA